MNEVKSTQQKYTCQSSVSKVWWSQIWTHNFYTSWKDKRTVRLIIHDAVCRKIHPLTVLTYINYQLGGELKTFDKLTFWKMVRIVWLHIMMVCIVLFCINILPTCADTWQSIVFHKQTHNNIIQQSTAGSKPIICSVWLLSVLHYNSTLFSLCILKWLKIYMIKISIKTT